MAMEIKRYLNSMGWAPASGKFWKTLSKDRPRIAFLAPPLDTIPSPSGSAIYCLVERLVERLETSAVALAMGTKETPVRQSHIADRLLYYNRPLRMNPWFRPFGYRLRKQIFGTATPEVITYGQSAGKALKAMGIEKLVVEDLPMVSRGVAAATGHRVSQILHQHASAVVGLPPRHWRRACAGLQGIVFVARRTLEETRQRHGDFGVPAKVIYNGIDLQHYNLDKWAAPAVSLRERLGISYRSSVLLYVGRLLPSKGVAESAEAFNKANVVNSMMLIIGDPQAALNGERDFMRRLQAATEESAGRIQLVGRVTQAELPKWYAASDAVIVPSLGIEGLPKVITEALAMGKPVLATDRGGSWELLRAEQNGWLICEPRDLEATAQVIHEALSDKDRLAQMSSGILNNDRPFMSEDRMVKEFADTLADWCPD